MYDAIRGFNKQFEFEPVIENGDKFPAGRLSAHPGLYKKIIVAGMGGSHLAADLLKIFRPDLDIETWSSYELPQNFDPEHTLIIISSHSGNTEEPVSAFHAARSRSLPMAAMAVGGEILELALRHDVAHVKLPDEGLQPRSALGHSFRGLLKLLGQDELLEESNRLSHSLDLKKCEGDGREIAHLLKNKIPVIYASGRNAPLAYIWKIKFNETGKIPAFYNIFPELDHNEINAYDHASASRALTDPFHFIFLKDHLDHPRVIKRLEVTKKIYEGRNIPVTEIVLKGDNLLETVFSDIALGDFAAYYTAELYHHDSENVPVIEELKRLMK
jgi:glucose/mannose-6-phosphate isomerase